jgi:flagellar basal body-associated protein FliL
MRISSVLIILKITLSLLLIALAIPLGDTFQHLMSMNYRAEYTFEVPIGSLMSSLGTFCLVSMLLLVGGWGILANILPEYREDESARMKELRIIILLVLLVLLIGLVIVGAYFAQRIDRWFS